MELSGVAIVHLPPGPILRFLTFIPCKIVFLSSSLPRPGHLLIPMDDSQTDHLKAYGITYWVLENGGKGRLAPELPRRQFLLRLCGRYWEGMPDTGVRFEVIPDAKYNGIVREIADPEVNMEVMKLETAPKIAVYSPKTKQPWDDAVTLVLTYAEIPIPSSMTREVMDGDLPTYDWLHLHHEDFTGQYGKVLGGLPQPGLV